ncbi:hypothetical protein ACFLQL_00730 [Verrucomicrobiota bacterium]
MDIKLNNSNPRMPRYEAYSWLGLNPVIMKDLCLCREDKSILVGLTRQGNGDFVGGVAIIPTTKDRQGNTITKYLHHFLVTSIGVRIGRNNNVRTRPHDLEITPYHDDTGVLKNKEVARAIPINEGLIYEMLKWYTGQKPYQATIAIGRDSKNIHSEDYIYKHLTDKHGKDLSKIPDELKAVSRREGAEKFAMTSLTKEATAAIIGWIPASVLPDFRFELYGHRFESTSAGNENTIGAAIGNELDNVNIASDEVIDKAAKTAKTAQAKRIELADLTKKESQSDFGILG